MPLLTRTAAVCRPGTAGHTSPHSMPIMSRKSSIHLVCLSLLGFSLLSPAMAAAAPLRVVASFSVLADLVENVAGPSARVVTLVPAEADPHVHRVTPSDVRAVARAELVVVNGLGFDHWMQRVIEATGRDVAVLTASRNVALLDYQGPTHGGHGHDGMSADPHAWHDIDSVRTYVRNIRDGLCTARPGACPVYRARAERYDADLARLHTELQAHIERVPTAARTIMTAHASLAYLARHLDLRLVSARGPSGTGDATASDMAALLRSARQQEIGAVFAESPADQNFIDMVLREAPVRYGGRLYVDTLSDAGGPAATYLDMMRHNVRTLVAALEEGG